MAEFSAKGYFINADGEDSRDHFKPKLSDDVVQPKKPRSAYIFFCKENHEKVKEANPDLGVTDIARQNAEAWNTLPESGRQKFQQMAEEDKERYKAQMEQLMSQGFFTTAEGVKSTDLAAKKRRASTDGKRKAQTQPDEAQISKKSPKRVKKE